MIYFDNGATTPLLSEVKDKMINILENFGNPSSLYGIGRESKQLVEDSMQTIADFMKCPVENLFITSGASESNSWVIYSAFRKAREKHKGNHIVCSMIEHHSIKNALEDLHKSQGVDITYVGTDKYGIVSPKDVEAAMRNDTFLVIVMTANNETGTIQPIGRIAEVAHKYGALIFTDATQYFGKGNIEFLVNDVNYLSASAHKLHGPKGIGLLYVSDPILLYPLVHGTQQGAKRGGTENVLEIVGFAEAVRQASLHMYEWNNHVQKLTMHLLNRILDEISGTKLNGHRLMRLCGTLNISFEGIRGEELLMLLDLNGVCVSTGSACNSASNEPSYVLLALGCTPEEANSSIRFSLSHFNTMEEVDYVVDKLKELISQLRGK